MDLIQYKVQKGSPDNSEGTTLMILDELLLEPEKTLEIEKKSMELLKETNSLCLDLTRVAETGSITIGVIIRLHTLAEQENKSFSVCPSLNLERLFNAMGVNQVVKIFFADS